MDEQTPVDIHRPPSAAGTSNFEHERILKRVLANMFGKVEHLEINERYRVLERLGAGGMGEVYLCDDLELERRVAVKHVRGQGTDDDQRRLLKEARAQARLSHPNVVRVYDAGTHEGRTFLAMEYVEGQTLAVWLAEGERSTQEILSRYIAAGRGLAAAHRANIVHRDFKPENVLIGVDGTVRVADFGLAIEPRGSDGGEGTTKGSPGVEIALSTAVMGGVRGTIRYMSLEHSRGQGVDARSDQFSFCLGLYEALWGEPPFSASSVSARRAALEAGEPIAPKSLRSLWRIIRRGLSREPGERWPDMDGLLDALEHLPRRKRRITTSLAALAALAALGIGASVLMRVDPCTASAQDLASVWSAERKTELEDQFRALEVSHVAYSWGLVATGLDQWAERWTAQRVELCRARESMQTEPARLRTRDQCLARQLREIDHFVTVLVDADDSILANAVVSVVELPSPSDCKAQFALSSFEPPSAAIAGEVEDLRDEIGRARELRRLGRVDAALTIAKRADSRAASLPYGPLRAEARMELAMAEDVAGSPLRSSALYDAAIDLAEVHRHDDLLPVLWTERAELSLFELPERERGELFLHRAAVAHERLGGPDARARARLAFNEGRVAELADDMDAARAAYLRAVDEAATLDGPELVHYLDTLARYLDPREGLELRARALELARERYGPRHPRTAEITFNYGLALDRSGKGGREQLELAADIWREGHRQPHPELGEAAYVLGAIALRDNDLPRARDHAMDAARVYGSTLDVEDHRHGEPHQLLAKAAGMLGNQDEALEHARLAASFFERSRHGARDRRALEMRTEAANLLMGLGRFDEAQVEVDGVLSLVGEHADLEVPARLIVLELSLRRGQLERANIELPKLENIGASLGSRHPIYDVLHSIVDLRSDRAVALSPERARAIVETFGADGLATWLEELGVSEAERVELGF